jgi:hypothetical protein
MMKRFNCTVKNVEKHVLPRLFKVTCEVSGGGSLIFEFHEDLELSYSINENLTVTLADEKIQPGSNVDYCGKAFLYKIIDQEKEKIYLFSMGGYIFRFSLPSSIDELKVAESYYICVSKQQ